MMGDRHKMEGFSPLIQAGFPALYLKQLAARGLVAPLPLQEQVLEDGGLLAGESALISAPTASGKTLLAEWCALARILENKRVFYLVPTRALAEEKFREFCRVFEPLGARVALSTGEYSELDREIQQGRISLVVTIVEKAVALLAQSRLSWQAYGLFVLDEAHLLGDPERGPTVDFFLTQWKLNPARPQLLALSAVVGKPERVANWLGIKCLLSHHRIAPLREGVCELSSGIFSFRESESRQRGEEALLPAGADELCNAEVFCALVRGSAGGQNGEPNRVLVFVSSRREAYRQAQEVLDLLELEGSRLGTAGLVEEAKDLSGFSGFLAKIRGVGVGVHTADLASGQREAVEDRFRAGECPLLFATPTLEQGVNLCADVVIHEPMMFGEDAAGVLSMTTLSASRFRNQGGRAGRATGAVGRSILFARNALQHQQLWKSIVMQTPEPVESTLIKSKLLSFFSQQLVFDQHLTEEGLAERLSHTFSALEISGPACAHGAQVALKRGIELGLWLVDGVMKRVELTARGELLALHRIAPETLVLWDLMLAKLENSASTSLRLEPSALLWVLMDCEEGRRLSLVSGQRLPSDGLELIRTRWKTCPLGRVILESIQQHGGWTSSRKSTLKQVLSLDGLCGEEEPDEQTLLVETTFTPGQLESLFRQLDWLSTALLELARLQDAGIEQLLPAVERFQGRLAELRKLFFPKRVVAQSVLAQQKTVDGEALDAEAEKSLEQCELEIREQEKFENPSLTFAMRHYGRVMIGETLLELTPLQFRLLVILALQPGVVVKYFEINRLMWPDVPKFDQQINYHRAKLEKALGVRPNSLIRCRSGHGLWLDLEAGQVALEEAVIEELGLWSLLNQAG